MKRRQLKHKYRTLQDIFAKKQKRSSIWKFVSCETFTTAKNLSWSELNRLQKKQKPVTDRGIRFRSNNRYCLCDVQNAVQWTIKMKSELQRWEDKISEEHKGRMKI